ncbi:MAG: hypothetical protein GY809_08535 [Planctomycetes bacterium]|nr:hypothetical protein [Planctomycetota bacterium]
MDWHDQRRGRQDLLDKQAETVKDIYAYPLDQEFRLKMNLPENGGLGALELQCGIHGEQWAQNEFGGAALGDQRLSNRLAHYAHDAFRQRHSGVAC